MIGRALVWRVSNECANANFDSAINDSVTATKFGFALSGGDAMDASLGFSTIDDARRALAPNLVSMGAGQLNHLAEGLTSALENAPPLSKTFDHEKEDMLRSVQYVQDAFLKNEFDDLRKQLGPDIRESVETLQNLRDQSSTKQAAYFEGFAHEADDTGRWLSDISELPLEERQHDPGLQLDKNRPWRVFARNFFTAGEPLLAAHDATLARTRLLILTARILADVKANGAAPEDLSGFDKDLATDPYTGRQFVYRAAGKEFNIHSVGEDLQDDGGKTDDSYSTPDLTLEMPQD